MRLNKQSLKFHTLAGFLNVTIVVVAIGSSAGWWIEKKAGTVVHAVPASVLAQRRAALVKQGKPVHISIPSLSIELPVLEGSYNATDDSWTLDERHAFFATLSSEVNNVAGTSLIYGHNLVTVFSKLKLLQPGARLEVKTDTNLLFAYEYASAKEVTPDDISVFNYTSEPNITLQTCSGPWDQLRTMHTFSFKSVGSL